MPDAPRAVRGRHRQEGAQGFGVKAEAGAHPLADAGNYINDLDNFPARGPCLRQGRRNNINDINNYGGSHARTYLDSGLPDGGDSGNGAGGGLGLGGLTSC